MWAPLLCFTIALLVTAINVAALRSSEDRFTILHNLASLSGGFGIFFMLCIPISLFYAISNYMFGPAQDTSIFFKGALVGACTCTLTSSVFSITIWHRDIRRDT